MAKKQIKVFGAGPCAPCKEVMELVKSGNFDSNVRQEGDDLEVDVIDITTEEGFPQVADLDITHVPDARYNGKSCSIKIDHEAGLVRFDCPEG